MSSNTFRKGDRVTLTGTITGRAEHDGRWPVKLDGAYSWHRTESVSADALTMDLPLFEIGDKVMDEDGDSEGIVVGVYEGWIWVRASKGGFFDMPAQRMQRVPPEPEPEYVVEPPPAAPEEYVVLTASPAWEMK